MDSQVRLLPVMIGAAAVVVVLRLAAMSVGVEASLAGSGTASAEEAKPEAADATPAEAPHEPAAAPEAAAVQTAAAETKPAESKPAEVGSGVGQAQNKGEADVLRGLSDRRVELDARENELALREQLLAATEKQVNEKIAELKGIQSKLDVMLAQRDDAQKAQLAALVKMYETMKPGDAAKIFEKLDPRILADVAGGMKPAKVGPILAAMDATKAQDLTALLANRLVLPEPQRADASAAAPVPAAMPVLGSEAAVPAMPTAVPVPTALTAPGAEPAAAAPAG